MRYWIKLYTEILKDPKMGRLTDRQFRTCINLFALAGEYDQEGALPSVADMGWILRMNEAELLDNLNELASVGIVRCINDTWLVCKWQERQAKAPSAAPDKVLQRVHEHRQRQRNEVVTTLHDEVKRVVTPPETDTDIETDTDTETESERSATFTPGPVVARASVTRPVGLKPNSKLSPAVNTFAKVTGKFPPRGIHHLIDAAFEARNDPDLLQRCYETWLARGYRPENIAWLQEWYVSGAIPDKPGNRTNGNGKPAADPLQAYSMADLAPATRATLDSMSVAHVQSAQTDPMTELLAYVDKVKNDPSPDRVRKQIEREIDRLVAAGKVTDYSATLTTALARAA